MDSPQTPTEVSLAFSLADGMMSAVYYPVSRSVVWREGTTNRERHLIDFADATCSAITRLTPEMIAYIVDSLSINIETNYRVDMVGRFAWIPPSKPETLVDPKTGEEDRSIIERYRIAMSLTEFIRSLTLSPRQEIYDEIEDEEDSEIVDSDTNSHAYTGAYHDDS